MANQPPLEPVVNPPVNLQFMAIPNSNAGQLNHAVRNVLVASRNRWLLGADWVRIFERRLLFAQTNSMTIPIEREGVYRIDNLSNSDRNVWFEASRGTTMSGLGTRFNVRVATGLYVFDDDMIIIHDDEVHEGWVLQRVTIRDPNIGGVAFVQYRYSYMYY